jgi:hypothetical protein
VLSTRLRATAFAATTAFAILGAPNCFADNGIYVGTPKSFDDSFLKAQLRAIQDQLTLIKAFDPTSIAARIGAVSGATLRQSSASISATGQAIPQVVTNVPAQSGDSQSGNVQETTQAALTPGVPTIPPSALTLPSTLSISALDAVNEALQLSYEASNISLLLNGSLNDRFLSPDVAKQRVTLGIPVTIDAPRFGHADDVAEVQVTVCTTPDEKAVPPAPSVIAVLPRENTYNVATLSETSIGLGVGAIAGVFSVNAGWLGAKKTFYLVKQQDTVALQKDPGDGPSCGNPKNSITVAWQFYPAAGTKYIRSGMRQMFLQLALPNAKRDNDGTLRDVSVNVSVRTLWRGHVWTSPAVSAKADDVEEFEQPILVLAPDTTPHASKFTINDVGSGNLLVRASGTFLQGLRARVGSSFFDVKSPGFFAGEEVLQFKASGQEIAMSGTALAALDGTEGELVYFDPQLAVEVDKSVRTGFANLLDRSSATRMPNDLRDRVLKDNQPWYWADPPAVLDCADHSMPDVTGVPAPSDGKSSLSGQQSQGVSRPALGKRSATPTDLANSNAVVEAASVAIKDYWKAERAKKPNYFRPLGAGGPRTEPNRRNPFYTNKRLKIELVSRERQSSDSWLVTVDLTELASKTEYLFEGCNGLPLVLTVNGKLYGLSDAPFFLREAVPLKLAAQPINGVAFYQIWYRLSVVVPDEVMTGQTRIKAQRLFMGRNFESEATYFKPPQLTAQKVAAVAHGKTEVWAITGSGLGGHLQLGYPKASGKIRLEHKTGALALLYIDKGAAPGLKQVVLLNKFDNNAKEPEVVTVAMPDDAKPETPAMSLDAAPVTVGATQLTVTGTALDRVALIRYLRTPVNIALTAQGKKTQLLVDLPPTATATPGTRYLDVTDADGKHSRLKLVVQPTTPAAT